MTVAGYHLHFLDDSRTVGGHVLDFRLSSGRITLDRDADLHVEMPTSDAFLAAHLDGGQDLDARVDAAENASGRPSPA
jgi:acetolactate decarboxylase